MNQANNISTEQLGLSWEILYGIDAGDLTVANRENFIVEVKNHADFPDGSVAECWYYGTAITIAEFANLPQGSIIWCPLITAAAAVYIKTARKGTDGWKYTVIDT